MGSKQKNNKLEAMMEFAIKDFWDLVYSSATLETLALCGLRLWRHFSVL